MTTSKINQYFTDNWQYIFTKGMNIHRDLNSRGEGSDLIQEGYLYCLKKKDQLNNVSDIEMFFTQFISAQIKWSKSKHNRSQTSTPSDTQISKVIDIFSDTSLDDKIEIHKWTQDSLCIVELYKQKNEYNRRFFTIFTEECGNIKKIAERIMLPVSTVFRMIQDMKDDIRRLRSTIQGDVLNFKDQIGRKPGDYIIAGCGPSIEALQGVDLSDYTVVGVNDIKSKGIDIDYHVVVDPLKHFDKDRAEVISETESKILFTHLGERLITTKSEKRCHLEFQRNRGWQPVGEILPKSNHSTFVAAAIAIGMGAKSLAFAGMDIADHPNWSPIKISQTRKHLQDMFDWCKLNGIDVYNLGPTTNIMGICYDVKQGYTVDEWIAETA